VSPRERQSVTAHGYTRADARVGSGTSVMSMRLKSKVRVPCWTGRGTPRFSCSHCPDRSWPSVPTRGGGPTWTATDADGADALCGVSCPTTSLCVLGDGVGNMVTSTNPTGGSAAETATDVDGSNGLFEVSCLGAAVDASAGNVVTSSDPTWWCVGVDGESYQRQRRLCGACPGGLIRHRSATC